MKESQLRAYENYCERRNEEGDSVFSLWLDGELREAIQPFADKHHNGAIGPAIRELVARGLQNEELVSRSLIKASYKEKLWRLQDENKALLNQNNRLRRLSHSLLRQLSRSRKKTIEFLFRCEKPLADAVKDNDPVKLLKIATEDDTLLASDKKEGGLSAKGYLSAPPQVVEDVYHIALEQFDGNIHVALRALLRKGLRL